MNDDQLRQLLKKWGDIEPKASFEANVWRRIRLAEAEPPERITIAEWLRQLMPRPALAMAAAVAVSVMIGSSMGVLTAHQQASVSSAELQFLGSGTLAGGYAKLIERGGQ